LATPESIPDHVRGEDPKHGKKQAVESVRNIGISAPQITQMVIESPLTIYVRSMHVPAFVLILIY